MTSRVGQPDTETDRKLYERLDAEGRRHFIMVAGAGSGKTTSLVKALAHLARSEGARLRRQGRQIACITYTEVAVGEISGDVGNDPLFHVSTIHSFLWTVIRPFQADLKAWVEARLDEKITEAEEKIGNPRTRRATKEKAAEDIERYRRQKERLGTVNSFRYGTGSDYANGVLGHSDILRIGPSFITAHALMRSVMVRRFPVVFVDESQDTDPAFVDAMRLVAVEAPPEFCLGFFGDPVQKIYMQGAGAIPPGEGWETFRKPENFRCPQKVLAVINRIRAEDDALEQTRGRIADQDGVPAPVIGSARLIILPADERRQERLDRLRRWLAQINDDPVWVTGGTEEELRVLVLVHRMAAHRLGFPNLYSSLNDKAPEELSSGLVDGTAWVVRPFLSFVLALISALRAGADFHVVRMLRKHCPRLQPEDLIGRDTAEALSALKRDLEALANLLDGEADTTIGDVVGFLQEHRLYALDERFGDLLAVHAAGEALGEDSHENAPHRFMRSPARELWGYQKYIERLSPFVTQQGIKGAEFERVLVVIDDEEGKNPAFSYGKYFGVTPLSDRDRENLAEGRDSVVERTRRLFYVCCSRALQDLAVVIFADRPDAMREALLARQFFQAKDIRLEVEIELEVV